MKPRGGNGVRKSVGSKTGAGGPGEGKGAGGGGGRGKGRGRPRKAVQKKRGLQDLLRDELAPQVDGEGGNVHRKRFRNAGDGENRWDRIRVKFKVLLQKMRRDVHFLQVYQQDGWRSSGRDKLKPTAELKKAEDRTRGVKAELRDVVKRLTEMNSGGSRWGAIQEDEEGNIEVDEVVCTKCGQGDSDDHDDILLCDYAGCFRAYHQRCLSPPIKSEAFPEPEEDWFCWQCECLTDCLDYLEQEFQGMKFTSWHDVFPEVDADRNSDGVAAGPPGGGVLHVDSGDDDDDESFKGSSSESEGDSDERVLEGAKTDGGSGSGSGDDGDEYESEADWMSDAESVGSDEVSKLYSEAGDLTFIDQGCGGGKAAAGQTSTAEGDRGSRALARRAKRSAALGLAGDDENRELAKALAGSRVDTANILESRTRRKKRVDYVKLNVTVFGDDSVEGDEDDEEVESSEAEARDEGCGSSESWKGKSPGAAPKAKTGKKPTRTSGPSADPGQQARKLGRSRKPAGAAPGMGARKESLSASKDLSFSSKPLAHPGQQARKRGRPRKTSGAVSRMSAGAASPNKSVDGSFSLLLTGENTPNRRSSIPSVDPETGEHRKRGRPRKGAEKKLSKMSSTDPEIGQTRKRGRPRERAEDWAGPRAGAAEKRRRGRPRKAETGAAGIETGAAVKRKRGRPRKADTDAARSEAGAGSEGVEAAPPGGLAIPYAPRSFVHDGLLVDADSSDYTVNGDANSSKGPARHHEDSDDRDELERESDHEEEAATGFPTIGYDDIEHDTADIAAVAAAVAAKAAEEEADRPGQPPTQSDQEMPPENASPSPARIVGCEDAQLACNPRG